MAQDNDVVERWCDAGERGDAAAAVSCLAAEVQLASPLTEQLRFHGRDQVRDLLTAAFTVVEDIQFHTRVGDGPTHALFYRARVGREHLEEAQLLRLDAAGNIIELTLFGRPLPALTGLMRAIGPQLARQQRRPALGALLTMTTAPLHTMARFGEKRIVPFAAPPA